MKTTLASSRRWRSLRCCRAASSPASRTSSPIQVLSSDRLIAYGDWQRGSVFSSEVGGKNIPARALRAIEGVSSGLNWTYASVRLLPAVRK
jgi:hypothetical protein